MKKWLLIIFLIILNFTILYCKIYSSDLKNIKLKLNDDELGIIIIHLENSTSLLLKNGDTYILYLLDYKDDTDLYINIELFTDKIDYVFMNEEYDLKYPYKIVIDGKIIIDDIRLEPNKISYKGSTFCINSIDNCDYVYLTEEMKINTTPKTIFYNELLSNNYIDKIHNLWTDSYKITENDFTILILNEEYEVIKLQHEY